MPKNDIQEFLSLLGNGGGKPTPPSRPTLEAQVMELQSRWENYSKSHDFAPGDLVREKRGLGWFTLAARQDTQLMFWRKLRPANEFDTALTLAWNKAHQGGNLFDCVVAFIHDDGVNVAFVPHEMAQLEPGQITR